LKKLGIIGQRGMVGSVLMQRMLEENDFAHFETYFFSTSQTGESAPKVLNGHGTLLDAQDVKVLSDMDILLSCQGGDYTKEIHPKLRGAGWPGLWIDAASTLRMQENAVIILDPINGDQIENALNAGVKDYVGGNCTVSLMLLGLGGLFKEGLVEWMTSMTYQAASGAGAKNMQELIAQMQYTTEAFTSFNKMNPGHSALEMEKRMTELFQEQAYPTTNFGAPLNLNLLPWIDSKLDSGQSREEWKGQVEANKILNSKEIIPIDGTCVRVGALRCHSQALTIKLKKNVELKTLEQMIGSHNDWVKLVANDKESTIRELTPAAVSGKMHIPVGRLRKMTLGDTFLNAFTVGDQLLWGAAEPLRRMLRYLR
jgi:aspartate-semialdehyde dehydrogenase